MTILTDKSIRALAPKVGKQYSISDTGTGSVRGLSLMVNPGGTKVFYFRYKTLARKTKRIKLGSYPSTGLSDARKKSRDYKKEIDDGADLAIHNSRSNLAKRDIQTISDLWAEYHIDALPRKKSAKFENGMWHKHVEKALGPLDVRSFTRDILIAFLVPFRRNHSPALGARVQALLSQLGGYAVERRVLEFSPAYQLGKKKPLPSNKRFLSRFELAVIWNSLSNDEILTKSKVSPSLAISLKLLLCTAARRSEVAGMEWNEIDYVNQTWIIPSDRTKNGRSHVIPLSETIMDILATVKSVSRKPNSRFLFPGRRGEAATLGRGHIRGDAPTRACSRLCEVLMAESDIEKFSPHDLRRSCATYMARDLKVDRFTISQILNHTSDKGGGGAATGIYARYDYLDEKKQAICAWTDYILKNSLQLKQQMTA